MTPEAAATDISHLPVLGDIAREELLRRLNDKALTIVDVLPPESYEAGHIPGAINLPLGELDDRAHELLPDPAAEIAIYCAKFT